MRRTMLRDLTRKVKKVLLGYRPCYACGTFFRGEGYEILGRRYCCEKCSPALYRKVVKLRQEERERMERLLSGRRNGNGATGTAGAP